MRGLFFWVLGRRLTCGLGYGILLLFGLTEGFRGHGARE
jgi:hypothetical protein